MATNPDFFGVNPIKGTSVEDTDLLGYFRQCFDRPAFKDPFSIEGRMEDFEQAITETIAAINTGTLYDREGRFRGAGGRGKTSLANEHYAEVMEGIVETLRAILARYKQAIHDGEIVIRPEPENLMFYYLRDDTDVARWMDEKRTRVLEELSTIFEDAGVRPLRFGRRP